MCHHCILQLKIIIFKNTLKSVHFLSFKQLDFFFFLTLLSLKSQHHQNVNIFFFCFSEIPITHVLNFLNLSYIFILSKTFSSFLCCLCDLFKAVFALSLFPTVSIFTLAASNVVFITVMSCYLKFPFSSNLPTQF